MFYAIRHFTRYRYSRPVWQSMMEVRMHPRSEGHQRCFVFQLSVNPRAQIFGYTDSYGNLVHHFDLPSRHGQLTIISDALVNIDVQPSIPEIMEYQRWQELEDLIEKKDYWDMLMPSHFARSSPELEQLAGEIGASERKGRSPLAFLQDIASGVHRSFSYVKKSTAVNSPIEDALRSRQGVCQDFAHIMIALVRNARIPCRYVSGYLYQGGENAHPSADGATHAWVEALLPRIGWIGFDPTTNRAAGEKHIRTAIGRDYADVPPTMGMMKGKADTQLQVRVRVTPSQAVLPPDEEFAADEEWSQFLDETEQSHSAETQQQQ
ncbi:MAG TPA: transglutaminase family protein [Candidatus Acidoferrum sp.]|jgi:transglutaminase-like putative cysteine protease|nr:transglutaminase family protein [Candidatus Acidoferrum sp.]